MKRKKRNSNLNIIKCRSLNVSNFINFCVNNGISFRSINRTKDNYVYFEIDDKNLQLLKKLDTSKYEFEIVKIGGLKNILNTLIYRIGLVVGLALSITVMLLLNNRLFRVHVYGLASTQEQAVIDSVKEYGIGYLSSLDFDKSGLEQFLADKFNFSLVSIITKGNSLIISVKEELPDISNSYVAITADYNMVIQSIEVYSGTAKVKSGDIVYKGDTLVEPFISKSGDIVYVTPCAKITAKAYFNSHYNFISSEEKLERSGKKTIISSEISLGKLSLFKSSKENKFEKFELENSTNKVSQYFLPIMIKKTYAHELKKVLVNRDFESEKEELIARVKNSAYSLVPSNLKVENEEIKVTDTSTGKIINVFLECNIELNYKYNN